MVINIPKIQMLQLQYKLALKICCDFLFVRDYYSTEENSPTFSSTYRTGPVALGDCHALRQVLGKNTAPAQEIEQSWLHPRPSAGRVPNPALLWLTSGSSAPVPAPTKPSFCVGSQPNLAPIFPPHRHPCQLLG